MILLGVPTPWKEAAVRGCWTGCDLVPSERPERAHLPICGHFTAEPHSTGTTQLLLCDMKYTSGRSGPDLALRHGNRPVPQAVTELSGMNSRARKNHLWSVWQLARRLRSHMTFVWPHAVRPGEEDAFQGDLQSQHWPRTQSIVWHCQISNVSLQ